MPTRRIPMRPGDLHPRDLAEIIARESRRYELVEVHDPDHPLFADAWRMLWDAFGPRGELEGEDELRTFLREDPFEPNPSGTLLRYFLIVAIDPDGRAIGVRDGTVLVNPALAPGRCVVYLSRLFVATEARGTGMSLWLRASAVEVAARYLDDLVQRGLIDVPSPGDPDGRYGMALDLVAEMSHFAPDDPMTWQRLVFYGRGGFQAVDPRDLPYQQPGLEDGAPPSPYLLVVRRVGREGQTWLPADEATAIVRLLWDDFATFCPTDSLNDGLGDLVARLVTRGPAPLLLLPLPDGPATVDRLRPLSAEGTPAGAIDRALLDLSRRLTDRHEAARTK